MRTHIKRAKEETGKAPSCTGALLEIKSIKAGEVKTKESDFFGCKQYTVALAIVQPKAAAGLMVYDRIRVGTPEDKDAKKEKTWDVSEGGPARLHRFLKRAGVAITDDDEEWMADAPGHTVVAPITQRGDFTNVGLYFRETDKDCPVIGLADGVKVAGAGKRKARPTDDDEEEEETTDEVADEDEDEKPTKKKAKKKADEEDAEEDEEEPAPKKKDKKPAEDEDEDEEDEPPAKKAKAKKKTKPADDDEDDD